MRQLAGGGADVCGFEAQLESWYRFLVDPAPFASIEPVACNAGDQHKGCRKGVGVDEDLLKQRADFLRPDSLVAVIMLTDENDCSIGTGPQSFLTAEGGFKTPRGTKACETDPWSPDCKSCYGLDKTAYPECADEPSEGDNINLRCFEQKRRFGVSRLTPLRRYVDGLTKIRLPDGRLNPLFCDEVKTSPDPNDASKTVETCAHVPRDPSMVFLAGIVGVPWQDIARDPKSLASGYLTAEQMNWSKQRFEQDGLPVPAGVDDNHTLWNVVLGETDPSSHEIVPTVKPLDPLMVEAVAPREGVNPATGASLARPDNPRGNPINLSERKIPGRDDLQYACTFKLPQPVTCDHDHPCDCTWDHGKTQRETPLCWDGSSYGMTQYYAKAYPGRRELAVLRGIGDQAIVSSVCPANMTDKKAPDYGYRPAIGALVNRLKAALQGSCWESKLDVAPDGTVPCIVLEASRGTDDGQGGVACPPCEGVREAAPPNALGALEGFSTFKEAGMHCVCRVKQVDPPKVDECVSSESSDGIDGWCYVDPKMNAKANKGLVAGCPAGSRRLIRFGKGIGDDKDKLLYLQCREQRL